MKITRIRIQNYKSIKDIDMRLSDKVNVFIGENSVGKSNIFAALEWVLGSVYPSFNNFPKENYYRGDESSCVRVRIGFDDGHFLEMSNKWQDRFGHEKSGLNIDGSGYVSDDIRQQYISAFIGPDRKISENPAANRWTVLGRLLRDINARFLEETVIDKTTGEVIPKSEVFKAEMQRIRSFPLKMKTETT